MNRKLLVPLALVGVMAPAVAGCGTSGGTGVGSGGPIVVGTTDAIGRTADDSAPLDPATSYDSATWNVFYNTFQMLLRYPRSGTSPEPDAAERCDFTDPRGTVYRCTLRQGLTFSNGHTLTSEDVKFSVDRMLRIKGAAGPSSLMAGVASVAAPDDSTVVFHLKAPDATFPLKVATPAAAILDSEVYAPDKPLDGFRIVGSGPYTLDSYKPGDKAVFSRNPDYRGTLRLNNDKVELRLFTNADAMEKAVKSGAIDVMTRTVRPDQINGLLDRASSDVKITEAPGTEARFLFFNTSAPSVGRKAVRQAVAQVIDRAALTRDVLGRTAEPLYSVVPQGITAHANAFFDQYGEPDPAKARAILRRAGITGRTELTYWYRQDLVGASSKEEAVEVKKQLEDSGLFSVTLKSAPWGAFLSGAIDGKYAVYGLSWLPDFPDPDNYIAPFFGDDNFLKLSYRSSRIEKEVIPDTRRESVRSATTTEFENAQKIIADDVPILPLWQGKQYIASRTGITGTEWALNSSTTTQFWELGRGATG